MQWKRKPNWIRDYVFLVVPLLLSITLLHNHSYWSLPSLLSLGFVASKLQRGGIENLQYQHDLSHLLGTKKTFITYFKGFNMLLTCLAILAVDFKVFPRRFAKTDLFGVGLMDLGVGTFIVSSAITSRHARGVGDKNISLLSLFAGNRSFILLLGLMRTVSVKLLSYQEKVSEYGTHWNFFVTLYFVWLIADIVQIIFPRFMVIIISLGLIMGYQFLLVNSSLTDYIISAPRVDILSANREGLVSVMGLVPLYLLSEQFAFYILHENSENTAEHVPEITSSGEMKEPLGSRWKLLLSSPLKQLTLKLLFAFLILLCLWILSTSVQATSRRLCNMSYLLLIMSLSAFLLLLTIIAEVVGGLGVQIRTLQCFCDHQLPIFLIANVITGVVNMSVRTINAPAYLAIPILLTYAGVITWVAWVLPGLKQLSLKAKEHAHDDSAASITA